MFPWFSFLTYAVVTAVTPGPNNIMSMSNGGRKGFRGALPFNFGIGVGFSIVMLLCTAFCSALSALIPKIKLPMLVAGAAYMLYLAWETFRSSGVEENHSREGFLSGLLLQFINPKIYIYCIMSMEAYILLPRAGAPAGGLRPSARPDRVRLYPVLVRLWLGVQMAVLRPRQGGEHRHGPAPGLLRRLPVPGLGVALGFFKNGGKFDPGCVIIPI